MKQVAQTNCLCPKCSYQGDQSEFQNNDQTSIKKPVGLEIYIGKADDSENEQDDAEG